MSLDELGPAFAVGVGELDEADADMCQTRARREEERREGERANRTEIRKERSRKRSAPAARARTTEIRTNRSADAEDADVQESGTRLLRRPERKEEGTERKDAF